MHPPLWQPSCHVGSTAPRNGGTQPAACEPSTWHAFGAQVAGILSNDVEQLGRALGSEVVVEAARGPLIPGFKEVKKAAVGAGAFGCTISGAGPTVVAVVGDQSVGHDVGRAMADAFRSSGGLEVNSVQVVRLDTEGARVI